MRASGETAGAAGAWPRDEEAGEQQTRGLHLTAELARQQLRALQQVERVPPNPACRRGAMASSDRAESSCSGSPAARAIWAADSRCRSAAANASLAVARRPARFSASTVRTGSASGPAADRW